MKLGDSSQVPSLARLTRTGAGSTIIILPPGLSLCSKPAHTGVKETNLLVTEPKASNSVG